MVGRCSARAIEPKKSMEAVNAKKGLAVCLFILFAP